MSTSQLTSFLYRLPIGRWLCPDVTVFWMLIVSLHVHVAADVAVFAGLPSVCVSNLQNAPVLVGVFFYGEWLLFKPHNKLLFIWITAESGWPASLRHHDSTLPLCGQLWEQHSLSLHSVKCQLRLRTEISRDGPQRTQILSHDMYIYTRTLIEVHTPSAITHCALRGNLSSYWLAVLQGSSTKIHLARHYTTFNCKTGDAGDGDTWSTTRWVYLFTLTPVRLE